MKCSHLYQNTMKCMTYFNAVLSIPYYRIQWYPCNTRHTRVLHVHQIATGLVITVKSPYFNKLLKYQDISHERCKTSYKIPYILAICLIVAFKYESHVTGHQIYGEIITYNTKLQGLCQVQTKMKSITLSCLIFQLENIFAYHLLVIIPHLMHIWCPSNIRVSRILHGHQNLVFSQHATH